ncbi:MAG: SpoIID/LytB domain-containing protein [Defluviitaleaceae bacterium]|nr:SpoIID/LytB domain-containing protein [Defluviitaleaceae bacterium]
MKKLLFIFLLILALAALAFPATALASTPATIRIGLTRDFSNRESINIGNTNITAGHNNNGIFSPVSTLHSPSGFTVRVTGGQVALFSGSQQVFTFTDTSRGAQIIDTNGGNITLGSYAYRGAIEFRPSGGRVTAINVLCPELYLFGVLPIEMSHSFHIEALKAQAVASRTFMVYRMNEGSHSHNGFDLCDNTHCQSYRGASREHASTTQAVNDTRGTMIYHNNAVILAVYFASSGGSTDNSENVWVQARPYLRAVRDIAEHDPVEWTRTFTWAQLTTASNTAGANIGTATGLSVTRTSPYGRAQEITVQGTGGEWRVTGEAIRNFFAPVGGALMSRNFHIAGAGTSSTPTVWVTDGRSAAVSGILDSFAWRNGAATPMAGNNMYVFDGTTLRRVDAGQSAPVTGGTGVTLVGRGWGHGVGMSQRGAHGMALAGHNYRAILLHYYTGVEVR